MGPMIIHTKTLQEAQELFALLNGMGYVWNSGEPLTDEDTKWYSYGEEMAYDLTDHGTVLYGDRQFFELTPHETVLPFEESMALLCGTNEAEPEPGIKSGFDDIL